MTLHLAEGDKLKSRFGTGIQHIDGAIMRGIRIGLNRDDGLLLQPVCGGFQAAEHMREPGEFADGRITGVATIEQHSAVG